MAAWMRARPKRHRAAGPSRSRPFDIALADLNGDGRLDAVTANAASDDVAILLGNGDGSFQGKVLLPAGKAPWALAVADLNGDGRPDHLLAADLNGDGRIDLVTTNGDSADLSVLLGNGDGSFRSEKRIVAGV